jgi:hypothetical protein
LILKKDDPTNHSTNSLTAFALPVFNIERLARVKSTFSESSSKTFAF